MAEKTVFCEVPKEFCSGKTEADFDRMISEAMSAIEQSLSPERRREIEAILRAEFEHERGRDDFER